MLLIDFSSKDGLRNAVLGHVFQNQVATCCPHCPTNELFVGQKIFVAHSIILLLSHVAPLAVSWHNERVGEVQLESEGKAQGKLLAAEATAAPV